MTATLVLYVTILKADLCARSKNGSNCTGFTIFEKLVEEYWVG